MKVEDIGFTTMPDEQFPACPAFIYLMFGYYQNGIRQKQFSDVYDIASLIAEIKSNSKKEQIITLRNLKYGSEEYSKLKEKLPSITPHGLFRDAKTLDNLIKLSGYMYFDIDGNTIRQDINAYKQELINKYGEYIHLAGLSVGGNGLFFYIKVKNLTVENFEMVYEYYRTVVFKDMPIDNNAKGIARNQFIPLDEQLYHNPTCVLDIPSIVKIDTKKIRTFNAKDKKEICYTLSVPFIPIDKLLTELSFETEVQVDDDLFAIDAIDYHKVYFPKYIQDGRKHAIFRTITQGLMLLNADVTLLQVQSYINYINQNHTTKAMRTVEMMRTVEWEYNRIKETGELTITPTVKTIHFNKASAIDKHIKNRIANKVNGLIKRYQSIVLIEEAKEHLSQNHKKITDSDIAKCSGLSLKTVNRNKHLSKEDIAIQILALNANGGVLDYQILDQTTNEYKPINK